MARKKDPLRNYKFTIASRKFASRSGFSSADGLNTEVEVIEYREGGDIETMRKIPGQTSYDNIVLERGRTEDFGLFLWMQQILDRQKDTFRQGPNGAPPPGDAFRDDVFIYVWDKAALFPVVQFVIMHAWPCRLEHDTLDARDAGDVWIERIELCHEGLYQVKPGTVGPAIV